MKAHYDDIAGQYAAYANASPTRVVELRTMQHMAGDVTGRSVLDLACGFGFYGRAMLLAGAASAPRGSRSFSDRSIRSCPSTGSRVSSALP